MQLSQLSAAFFLHTSIFSLLRTMVFTVGGKLQDLVETLAPLKSAVLKQSCLQYEDNNDGVLKASTSCLTGSAALKWTASSQREISSATAMCVLNEKRGWKLCTCAAWWFSKPLSVISSVWPSCFYFSIYLFPPVHLSTSQQHTEEWVRLEPRCLWSSKPSCCWQSRRGRPWPTTCRSTRRDT